HARSVAKAPPTKETPVESRRPVRSLYFTSADGIHWDRRDLSVVEVAGRRDHNIVFASDMVPSSRRSR
ncbi:MAG TPA: hypothetical protein VJL29_07285, partial [Thermoguttaceae bacterium]|nr:hypothetical protein [Thermoguttaceae bacterium]